MKMKNILVVEDDVSLSAGLTYALEKEIGRAHV